MTETFLCASISVFVFVAILVVYHYWQWCREVNDKCDIGSLRCKLLRDQLLRIIDERIEATKREPSDKVPNLMVERYRERRYEILKAMNKPEDNNEQPQETTP